MKAERRIAALVAAGLLAFTSSALAQPYLALDFSDARADLRGTSGSGSASAFTAGYRFGEHLALEASYLDTDVRSDPSVQGANSTMQFWKSRGPGIAAVGMFPVAGSFSLIGKAGAYRLKTSTRELVTGAGGTLSDSTVTSSAWRSTLGIGAQFNVAENVSLRAMLEHVDGKGELDSLRLFTLGAVVGF
jgi:opacity protein-like surface antigen